MSEFLLRQGDKIILSYQLFDGDDSKFVRAYVTNESGVTIAGSPFNLMHQGQGKYVYHDNSFTYPSGAEQIHAVFVVFDDVAYSVLSKKHSRGLDTYYLDPSETSLLSLEDIDQKLDQIISVLSSTFPGAEITGIIEKDEVITGYLSYEEIHGFIDSSEVEGVIDYTELIGLVQSFDLEAEF